MKKILCCFILIALVVVKNKAIAQSANRSLSNLTSPTKLNTDLLPDSGNTHNLGSAPRAWKNFFMKGAFFLDGTKFIANGGTRNIFFGSDACKSNTTGFDNIAIGYQAMYKNTTGFYNIAIGNNVLHNSMYCYNNIAIGDSALYKQTKEGLNIAIGSKALFNNDSGYFNTAVGLESMYSNTYSKYNTAIGDYSLHFNTTGNQNTASGDRALYDNTSGNDNTAYGYRALDYNQTGSGNTAIGSDADAANYNGASNNNSAFGHSAQAVGESNCTAIGYGAYNPLSDRVQIGNNNVTYIGGVVNWNTYADGRVKRNIKQNVPGLVFINKLQPVTYNLDLDVLDKIVQRPAIKDKDGNVIQPLQSDLDARAAKQKIIYTGFIAQDVEKAAKSLNYDFSGVDAAKNDHDLYGLRYAEFVVPLVKAVQELSRQNDSLQKQNDAFEKRIEKLEAMMNVNQSTANSQLSTISSVLLEQNIPNPFSNTTIIHYTLPQQYASAKIIITDKNGNALKQINLPAGRQGLSDKGKGSVTVDASTLSSGAYQYSLIIDGKIISSKQMILSK